MLTEENGADAYEDATNGCRRLIAATRDNARRVIDADQAIQDAEEREARRESQSVRTR